MTLFRIQNRMLVVVAAALFVFSSAVVTKPAEATGYGIYVDYALGSRPGG